MAVDQAALGRPREPMRRSRPAGFGWADLLGPIGILSTVFVGCIFVLDQGVISLVSWPSGVGSWGLLTGLVSWHLMVLQVMMLARIPWVERAWGHDLLTHRHRWVGFVSFWLMIAHVVAYMIERSMRGTPVLTAWWQLFVLDSWMLWATAGTVLIIVVVVLSLRAARRRMRYEPWHLLHLYAYLGMALALPHELADGSDFHTTWAQAYWWTWYLGSLAAILAFRIGLPIWRSVRHRLRVAAVDVEAPGVVSVHVTGRHLHRMRTRSGQFFIWRFRDGPGWTRGNPYTISAAPTNDRLRVTIQAVGDGSERAARLRPGTPVYIEGPYGTMTAERRRHPHALFVAAGVGITPIRALLEDMPYAPGEATLIYRYSDQQHAIFLPELDELAARRGVIVHYLPGARRGDGSWQAAGVGSHDDATALRRLVPQIADADVFVCGPPRWITSVKAAARQSGADRADLHSEDFAW
ncbi:ferredoxin reductase family protein [Dactylosporangium sp. NPDC005572]|uniref:ferredoxin reductase family protein n=1 Tax=Dactylosporangium sp. NPDC005572 TaxID=3156889 RepID=UPI0033A38B2F